MSADLRPPALPFHRDNRIVVPQDKRGIVLQDIQLTVRLYNLLFGLPYVVLGDLDGRSFGELGQHPGMGHACQRHLHEALASIGVVVPAPPVETPAVPTIHVPEFATEYRLDELPLSGSRALWEFSVLGELHGKPVKDLLRLPRVGSATIQELQSLLAAMAAAGPPAPAGLLDLLDVGLDGLPEDRRRLLLARFGGAGEEPLTLAELGRQHDRTRSWIAIMQARALDRLRTQAGPVFGRMLRDLENRVSTGRALLSAELARVGRLSSPSACPRPWDTPPFYERLLATLAPGLVRGARGKAPGPGDRDTADLSETSVDDIDEAVVEARREVHPASDHEAPTTSGYSTLSGPSEEANTADPTRTRPEETRSTRTDAQRAADDAALLASGEPLGLLSKIAPMLGVSAKTLRWVVQPRGVPLIRYVSSPRPVRYCIADVQAAVEAARPDIEARRRRAEEIEAAERARGEASRAARLAAPRKTVHVSASARPRGVAPAPASATRSKQSGPEVLVARRPAARPPPP